MFEFVRTHTRLLQFMLLLVIFPSFVFWGIQGYRRFNEGAAKTVAKVDGIPIKQGEFDLAHRRRIEMLRAQSPEVDLKQLDTAQARRETLDALVRERVIAVAAEKQHLTDALDDERLERLFKSDPQFAPLRNPDGSINKDLLAAQGMSSEMFAARLRQDLALRQVMQSVSGTGFEPKATVDATLDALLQQREIVTKRFDASAYMTRVNPTDAEVEAYYKANPALFRAPEQAQIEYAVLDTDAIAKTVTVPEEELRKYYDENSSRYTVAEERRARMLLVGADKSKPQAERDKAKAKAQALLEQLRKNPASFADVAKKESDDKASGARGGDIDFIGRGALDKPLEDALFSMKPGEISNVVESDLGYHVFQLTEVRGGDKKPFEAVRADIEQERRKQLAQQRYSELAEQFTNTVYEQSDSLQPVIDKLKLEKKTATVQRQPAPGAAGALASQKFLAAVFGNDALNNKRNTEAIEFAPGALASAHVLQHTPERTLPFDEVKERVRQAVRANQAAALARKEGEALLEAVKKGGDIPEAKPVVVSRVQPQGLPREVVLGALKADLAKPPAVLGVDLGEVGYVVLKVAKIVPRNPDDAQAKGAPGYVSQSFAAAEGDAYYEALKQRYKVQILEEAPTAGE